MADKTEEYSLDLTLTRSFDASPDLVFRMFSEAQHMNAWSCPDGFTIVAGSADFRPGGNWQATMRGPDGKDLRLGGSYREIVPPGRLVFTHAWIEPDGTHGPETMVTVSIEPIAGKSRLTLHQSGFANAQARDGHRGGWSESLDKLERHLRGLASKAA